MPDPGDLRDLLDGLGLHELQSICDGLGVWRAADDTSGTLRIAIESAYQNEYVEWVALEAAAYEERRAQVRRMQDLDRRMRKDPDVTE